MGLNRETEGHKCRAPWKCITGGQTDKESIWNTLSAVALGTKVGTSCHTCTKR